MMEKIFKVLKDFEYKHAFGQYVQFRKDEILKGVEVGDFLIFDNIFRTSKSFYKSQLENIFIEEILPNKKPISSEENTNIEEDIYSKKYNIYEILTLIPNLPKDAKFKCSLNAEVYWYSSSDFSTLTRNHTTDYNDAIFIEDIYTLRDILEATYTIIKPVEVEEVKEKWIRIASKHGLCREIVNGKTIKVNGCILEKDYTDDDIENMFDQLQYGVVECLEEN